MRASWWMTGLVGLVVGGAMFAVLGSSQAQDSAPPAEPTRVACVDIVRAYNEYQRQIDINTEMEEVQERLKLENRERLERIDQLQTALAALDPADPNYRKKQDELLRQQVAYRNWSDLIQASLARELSVWTGRMYQEITNKTAQIAEERGIELVLYLDGQFIPMADDADAVREQIRSRRVLYAAPELDLTDAVITAINAQYRALPPQKMLQLDLNATP